MRKIRVSALFSAFWLIAVLGIFSCTLEEREEKVVFHRP